MFMASFRHEFDYKKNEWLFNNRKERLYTLKKAYEEYARLYDIAYENCILIITPTIHEHGVEAEGCTFGKVDYSLTTYSIEVKALILANNEREAEFWKRRFEEVGRV